MALPASALPAAPAEPIVRPQCPQHPGSKVWLDGYFRKTWSEFHRRPRYRCVTMPGTRGHSFSLPVPVRQPSDEHPDSGAACPHCEHRYGRHEGVKTGSNFTFGQQEIASLLLRLGEGMSLRAASAQLRQSVFRVNRRSPKKPPFKRIRPGETSHQANLAVAYLDAFAEPILRELLPRAWPRVIIIDSTTLMTRGYRPVEEGGEETAEGADEKTAGNLKAGTILFALDGSAPQAPPVLIRAAGGKDVESWKTFFGSLSGAPQWVVADLDPAIARAVRETWPHAILYHSRHHLAELMRKRAREDGIPERVKLDEPVQLARPIPWSPTRSTLRRYGPHPLMAAIAEAQRGEEEWGKLREQIAEHLSPDKLALRSWIATNEVLIRRQWEIARVHGRIPLSTGALEGKLGEWVAPLRRRAGRWQNLRRLNLVLGLIALRARGEAREARYAGIIRRQFAAKGNRSHLPADNLLPFEAHADGTVRQMSWWRSWHDRDDPSLPRLVFESSERTKQRAEDDQLRRYRERLATRYEEENDLRAQYGVPKPPVGRPKRPNGPAVPTRLKGKMLRDFPDLLLEWDWVFNGDLDPNALKAGSSKQVAWRCALNDDHTWETKVSDRTYRQSFCPYHMGNRVHPSESLAAYFPWLALEWHPTANDRRPDEVTQASAREITWRCRTLGHEWPAVVYQRTRGKSGCPECAKLEASERTKAGLAKARAKREAAAAAQVRVLTTEQLTEPEDLF